MNVLLIESLGNSEIASTTYVPPGDFEIAPPLGLLYIGRALEDEGHHVTLIQPSLEKPPWERITQILKSSDAVGISILTQSFAEGAQLASRIKDVDSSIPIIIGGPHCTFHPREALKHIPDADFSIEGEGEYTIKSLTKMLEGKQQLSTIPGIYYRQGNTIQQGKPHQLIMNLDEIPFPARHLVDNYEYGKVQGIQLFKPKVTSMITSRGCPFHCRFCPRNSLSYNTFRKRSVENIVEELRLIEETYHSVFIVDDNFLTDKKRAHKILDMILKEGITLDLLILGARVDSAERSLYQKMKQAGVKYIEFGIESGNQDVLDYYNKKITLEQITKAVSLAQEMKFITNGNFILGAPFETEDHINRTFDFACSLPLDIVRFRPLYYAYGSDLWNEAVQHNLISENEGFVFSADKQKGLGNFTEEELLNLCIKGSQRFYLNTSYFIRQIIRLIIRRNLELFRIGWKMIR